MQKNNIFLEHSIWDIQSLINTRDISYLDLAKNAVENIERYEHKFHAWVNLDINALLKNANKCDANFKNSPIYGLPFGVKDIFNTKSFSTEMGSYLWKGFTPGNNARVVDMILDAGGLILGKTVTAEFAVHSLNSTKNPHDVSKTPGTSSSGSAVAVALGMVPYALGSQTAGSIIRPASFCGVWGMKPSFGLIPRTGVLKTTDSLDTIGFLTTHGKNMRPILDQLRVSGPDYPYVYKNIDQQLMAGDLRGQHTKVGFVKTHVWNASERYVQEAILKFLNVIGSLKNYEVEELPWPEFFTHAHERHNQIYTKSLAYYFESEASLGHGVTDSMLGMINVGERVSIDEFMKALEYQNQFSRELNNLLLEYDFVISIGTSSSAPVRGIEEIDDPALLWTMSHIPAISVPLFRGPDGMPFSVQLISSRWSDYKLLYEVEKLIEMGVLPRGSAKILNKISEH